MSYIASLIISKYMPCTILQLCCNDNVLLCGVSVVIVSIGSISMNGVQCDITYQFTKCTGQVKTGVLVITKLDLTSPTAC